MVGNQDVIYKYSALILLKVYSWVVVSLHFIFQHKKKNKKKGKDTTEITVPTRQPFDRDRDLFASRVDPLKRRALIERSKQLGSRFAHGGQKYLWLGPLIAVCI